MKENTLPSYLAFDTSTETGSVCICREKTILDSICFSGQGRHSADLLSKINEIIDKQGLVIADIQGVVVGEGPGSFTGVRVAAATAKGLCHSLGIPLWAVSSLRAGAISMDFDSDGPITTSLQEQIDIPDQEGASESSQSQCVLFDARENRVYAACYRPMLSGDLETIMAPHSTTIEKILLCCDPTTIFAGGGAQRHSDQIYAAGFQVAPPPAGVPTAAALHKIAMNSPKDFRVTDISVWEPQYLRVSSAERLLKEKGS